tara:strand:+ start:3139 stop:3444 length:306 start_codon:yes stop_codon:yes gene_type:complete
MPYALIEDKIVVSTAEEITPFGDWVECDSHDIHGWTYTKSTKKFTDKRPPVLGIDDITPAIPKAYLGLNFTLEEIQDVEDGKKTIEEVKAAQSEEMKPVPE